MQAMGWENMAFVFFNHFLDLSEVSVSDVCERRGEEGREGGREGAREV